MKKRFHAAAIWSAAALMTAFTPAFAAPAAEPVTGWVQEGEDWCFYDSDGYKLTDSWKKEDGNWFYLDEDGAVAFDRQIDEYYVGSDGKRVSDQWVSVENTDSWDSDDAPEFYWYYYGKDGKATVSRFKNIEDKTYYFDSEGRMAVGLTEIDGASYYFGGDGDGAMRKGWVELDAEDYDNYEDESVWSYFDASGKRVENQIDRKISGGYYSFEDGIMVTGWYRLPAVSEATASNAQAGSAAESRPVSAAGYQYYDADGRRANGWRTIEGIEGLSEEDELFKFYFKSGQPYYAETGIQVFTTNSGKYGFNTKGEMQTGLQQVTLADGTLANFYFGDDGAMKTGKQSIFDEESDMTRTWFFHTEGEKRGQGYHGILDGKVIYENGLRKEADAELRYAPVTFEGKQYLVNASGTIQKASASSRSASRPELGAGFRDMKDANDTIWTVNTDGVIQ